MRYDVGLSVALGLGAYLRNRRPLVIVANA